MKEWKIFFLLAAVLVFGLAGLSSVLNAENSKEKESKAQENYKVTFIEIGSVRCIPCKKMAPIIEEIKKEYAGQVNVIFYDVWTDEGKPFGAKYGVRLIPTQIFLDKDGKEYFRHEGFFPKEKLVEKLKEKGVN